MASPAGRGAQVRLDGDAQKAARGGLGSSLAAALEAKRILEFNGQASDGTTLDGSTRTGVAAEDEVLTPGGVLAGGSTVAFGQTAGTAAEGNDPRINGALPASAAAAIYAPKASPAFTGIPTAPSPAAGALTLQLANALWVRQEIAALINSAPGTLDTLGELANALASNPDFATNTAASLAAQAAQITALSANVTTLQTQVSTLQTAVTTLQGNTGGGAQTTDAGGDFSTLAVNYAALPAYTQVVRYPTGTTDPTGAVTPAGVTASGTLTNLLNATFVPGGTMDTRAKLEARSDFLMIFGNMFGTAEDGRDGNYANYRARYRSYPQTDPRNLHVFTTAGLKLKARGTGTNWANVGDGQIEGSCVRFLTKFTKGSIIEVKAKFPPGAGSWPAFWWVPGEQDPYSGSGYPVARFQSGTPFFEVDLIDNYGYDQHDSRFYEWYQTPNYAPSGNPGYHGDTILWSASTGALVRDTSVGGFHTTFDNSAAMHTRSVEWRSDDKLIWRVDGNVVFVKHYFTEPSVSSHLMLTNEAGPLFNPQIMAGLTNQGGVEDGWSFTVEHVRIWSGASNIDLAAAPYNIVSPTTLPDTTVAGLTVHNWWDRTGVKLLQDLPNAWNATENTLVVSVTPASLPMAAEVLCLYISVGNAPALRFRTNFFGTQGFWISSVDSGFTTDYEVNGLGGTWAAGVKRTVAIRFKAGAYAYSINGGAVVTSTESLVATGFTKGSFGCDNDNTQAAFSGQLKVQHVAGAVSNAQLITLSAQ